MTVEERLTMPYWVIDILPEQVPADRGAHWLRLERACLAEPHRTRIRRRFAGVLLRLNAYVSFRVMTPEEDMVWDDPAPDRLAALLTETDLDLLILPEGEDSLITVNRDDLYMTLYHPSDAMLRRVGALAAAEGLFLRRPPREGGDP